MCDRRSTQTDACCRVQSWRVKETQHIVTHIVSVLRSEQKAFSSSATSGQTSAAASSCTKRAALHTVQTQAAVLGGPTETHMHTGSATHTQRYPDAICMREPLRGPHMLVHLQPSASTHTHTQTAGPMPAHTHRYYRRAANAKSVSQQAAGAVL